MTRCVLTSYRRKRDYAWPWPLHRRYRPLLASKSSPTFATRLVASVRLPDHRWVIFLGAASSARRHGPMHRHPLHGVPRTRNGTISERGATGAGVRLWAESLGRLAERQGSFTREISGTSARLRPIAEAHRARAGWCGGEMSFCLPERERPTRWRRRQHQAEPSTRIGPGDADRAHRHVSVGDADDDPLVDRARMLERGAAEPSGSRAAAGAGPCARFAAAELDDFQGEELVDDVSLGDTNGEAAGSSPDASEAVKMEL